MLMGILGAAGAWWDASVDVRGRACMASGFGCVHAPSLVAMEAVGVRRRVSLASGSVRVPGARTCVRVRVFACARLYGAFSSFMFENCSNEKKNN